MIVESLTTKIEDAFRFIEQYSLEIALSEELEQLQANGESEQAATLEQKLKEEKEHPSFPRLLQQFHQLDEAAIEDGFYKSLLRTFQACHSIDEPTQAIFFEYEQVDDAFAPAYGFGPAEYKLHLEPETMSYKLLLGKETFSRVQGIDFTPAWQPVLAFSWLVWDYEVYYFHDMVRLFELNAYRILYHAINRAVKSEAFTKMNIVKPFHFYANEHDCGSYSIYIAE